MKVLIKAIYIGSIYCALLQVLIAKDHGPDEEVHSATEATGAKGNKTHKDPSSNIPKNHNEDVYCAKCDHCETPPPETKFIKRTDARGISYCYTKQMNEKGLAVVERGVIRPRNKEWKNATVHEKCPAVNYILKTKTVQWCFCSDYGCNTERTWINGEVLAKVAKPVAKPKQDEALAVYDD